MLPFLLAFVAWLVGDAAWRSLRSPKTRLVLREINARRTAIALARATTVIVVGVLLIGSSDYLASGWLSLLDMQGSLAAGSARPKDPADTHFIYAVAPILLPVLLLLAMPRLVLTEERMFRSGIDRRTRLSRALRPALFGLSHLIMGIPVGAAMALILPGLWFQRAYLRAVQQHPLRRGRALAGVAAEHLLYNYVLLALMFLGVLLMLLRG